MDSLCRSRFIEHYGELGQHLDEETWLAWLGIWVAAWRELQPIVERLERIITTDTCCVYCGAAYSQGTPRFGDNALTEHIKVCLEHPMREAEERIKELEEALRDARRQIPARTFDVEDMEANNG